VKIARWLIVVGSVVLFLTALLHGSGYAEISRVVEMSGMKPFLIGAFKALWLMLSIHLLVLSAIFIVASQTPKGRRLVLLCTLIPAFDTVLLFHFCWSVHWHDRPCCCHATLSRRQVLTATGRGDVIDGTC
jgi:hypothetical protein